MALHEMPSLGDAIDFVALALYRSKLEAARWIIPNSKVLPECFEDAVHGNAPG